MGKQINFLLIPDDIKAIENEMMAVEPMIILHSESATATPVTKKSLMVDDGKSFFRSYLVRSEDLSAVVMRNVPNQGYWIVDVTKSPVIEFDRCFFDGKTLRPGRIYCIDKFFGSNNELIPKSGAFLKWNSAIWRRIKKVAKKDGYYYVGPNAAEWLSLSN